MNYLIFKLLGIPTDHAGRIVGASLSFRGEVPVAWLTLLAIVLAAGTVFLYRFAGSDIPRNRTILLGVLRAAFLALILVIFAGPILSITYADTVHQSLLMLFDSSDSMDLQDLRTDRADQARAAIAQGYADPGGGISQNISVPKGAAERPTRAEILSAALKNEKLNLLARLNKEFEVTPLTFDRELHDVVTDQLVRGSTMQSNGSTIPVASWVDGLQMHQPSTAGATALGDAIRDAIYRNRGRPVAGIVMATDGGNNFGIDPLDAAKLAFDEHVPLYIYGIGVTRPRDVIVSGMFVQPLAFLQDEVSLSVHVRSQGLKGQTGQLVLKLGDRKVDEKAVNFGDDDEIDVPMKFTPNDAGEFDLTATIEPRTDEISQTNNSVTRHIRVIDGRIKVLQIEQQPRFEFKFLQVQLLRDRRVDYKFLLLDGDPGIGEGSNSPYLPQFPETLAELAKYDLIIFGDVDPARLPRYALPNISEFVARFGGSFIMIAGRHFSPSAYEGTPIEDMLPIEFSNGANTSFGPATFDRPIQIELTEQGKANPMLRLADDRDASIARWAQFPPLYWDYRVLGPKSLAEVLLVDADGTKASRFGKMPLIAMQGYGAGQVLWIGTDELWRYRRNTMEQSYLTFWGQTIQRMSLAHMLGSSKRAQLRSDKEEYASGDPVSIEARLYDTQMAPLTAPTIKGLVLRKGAAQEAPREIVLRQVPSQDGRYRAEFVAPEAGAYSVSVENDPTTTLDFTVIQPNLEQNQTAMNEALLRSMAQASGGAFFREEDLYKLPDQIHQTVQPVYSTSDAELAFSPLYFLLLMAVVTAEWILRKMTQLR
jgi:hypothetical protein